MSPRSQYTSHAFTLSLWAECVSERAAWQVLGYTQRSWDNFSGREQQPWASIKYWSSLTDNEKAAAESLGYTETSWNNLSGKEPALASGNKRWSELIACPNGTDLDLVCPCAFGNVDAK